MSLLVAAGMLRNPGTDAASAPSCLSLDALRLGLPLGVQSTMRAATLLPGIAGL